MLSYLGHTWPSPTLFAEKSALEVVFAAFLSSQLALVPDGIVAQMRLHCFVHHSGTSPVVFEALHQFTLGVSIKRPFPKKKGSPVHVFIRLTFSFYWLRFDHTLSRYLSMDIFALGVSIKRPIPRHNSMEALIMF